ncbi:MAG: PilZ domain-containing protein [Candidatus Omnitrophota bacterium]|jgi:c-di-GMP-binding flagellar brake protein YcgR
MAPEDQRNYRRLTMKVNIRYRAAGPGAGKQAGASPEKYGVTVDFSAGGLAFHTDENYRPESLLEVTVELPAESLPMNCLAKVVRTVREGSFWRVAVLFMDLPAGDRARIDRFVAGES